MNYESPSEGHLVSGGASRFSTGDREQAGAWFSIYEGVTVWQSSMGGAAAMAPHRDRAAGGGMLPPHSSSSVSASSSFCCMLETYLLTVEVFCFVGPTPLVESVLVGQVYLLCLFF